MKRAFGETINFLRNDVLKMSRKEFEEFTKIPNITIQKWEYGKSEPPEWNQEFILKGLINKIYGSYNGNIYYNLNADSYKEFKDLVKWARKA